MSNRFHNKWHRVSHHTYKDPNIIDAGWDPIASHESPFRGDFVIDGGSIGGSLFSKDLYTIHLYPGNNTVDWHGDTITAYSNFVVTGNETVSGNTSGHGWIKTDSYLHAVGNITGDSNLYITGDAFIQGNTSGRGYIKTASYGDFGSYVATHGSNNNGYGLVVDKKAYVNGETVLNDKTYVNKNGLFVTGDSEFKDDLTIDQQITVKGSNNNYISGNVRVGKSISAHDYIKTDTDVSARDIYATNNVYVGNDLDVNDTLTAYDIVVKHHLSAVSATIHHVDITASEGRGFVVTGYAPGEEIPSDYFEIPSQPVVSGVKNIYLDKVGLYVDGWAMFKGETEFEHQLILQTDGKVDVGSSFSGGVKTTVYRTDTIVNYPAGGGEYEFHYPNESGILALIENIASDFDEQATYAIGQLVTYNRKLYRCIATHSGPWNDAHFEETTVEFSMPWVIGEGDDSVVQKQSTADPIVGLTVGNRAISQSSISEGMGSFAGLKGYRYTNTGSVTNSLTFEVVPEGWAIGDVVSVVNDSKYPDCATIASISGTKVTFTENLPFDSIVDEFDWDSKIAYISVKPFIGNIDLGYGAYAEGVGSKALNAAAHAEGRETKAFGQYSHTEGRETKAQYCAHAEGRNTEATGNYSHAEGVNTEANFKCSHTEGYLSKSLSDYSHAEGYNTNAGDGTNEGGWCSHAEGNSTVASGQQAHAEGLNTVASGVDSHAEGTLTIASGKASHAEGSGVSTNILEAKGQFSHAEGACTHANGSASHAEGYNTVANGANSHAEGGSTITQNWQEHAEGRFNLSHKQDTVWGRPGNTLHSVGYGTSESDRKNALEIMQNGKVFITGVGGYNGTNPTGNGVKDVATVMETIQFEEWFPGGEAKSIADCTADLKYDWDNADETNHTIKVLAFVSDGVTPSNWEAVGDIVIPPYVEHEGVRYTVIAIGDYGDQGTPTGAAITSLKVPTTVTQIGYSACFYCNALTSVSLPAVTDIGGNAFSDCPSLAFISLPAASSIGVHAFDNCTALTTVDFGPDARQSVPELGFGAFPDLSQSGHTCKIIVPDANYDAWTTDPDWAALTSMGYEFLRHSEWEYARKFETVPPSRTVNGKSLNEDVTLTGTDILVDTSSGAQKIDVVIATIKAEAGFTEWHPAGDDPGYSLISVTYGNDRWTIVVLIDGETSPVTYTDDSRPDATSITFDSNLNSIERTRLPTMADVTLTERGPNHDGFSEWTIFRDGVDVTAQITEMPHWRENVGWIVFHAVVPGDLSSTDAVDVGQDALYLNWKGTHEGEDLMYTATREALPGYILGNQTEKPIPKLSDVPAVVSPSTDAADAGKAADAKKTGDALDGKLSRSEAGLSSWSISPQPQATWSVQFERGNDETRVDGWWLVIDGERVEFYEATEAETTLSFSDYTATRTRLPTDALTMNGGELRGSIDLFDGEDLVGVLEIHPSDGAVFAAESASGTEETRYYLNHIENNGATLTLPTSDGTLALTSTLAAPFSASTAYPANSYVTHDGLMYKCASAVSAGDWDATEWTQVDLMSPDATFDVMADGRLRLSDSSGNELWSQGYGLASSSATTLSCDKVNYYAFAATSYAAFSTESTYAVDAVVTHNGKVYTCTTAVDTAGAWTGSTNWTETPVSQEFTLPRAGSGKVGDFILDVSNENNAGHEVNISLSGTLGTDYDIIVPIGESISSILVVPGGGLAEFYFTMTAFGTAAKPAWKVVRQLVEREEATVAP